MNSLNKNAKMAGFLYLIYMVISIFADVGVRSKLIVLLIFVERKSQNMS